MFDINGDTLNCVLMGLILAVIIILVVKIFKGKTKLPLIDNKENMNMDFAARDPQANYRFDDRKMRLPKCKNQDLTVDSSDESSEDSETQTKESKSTQSTQSSESGDIESEEKMDLPVEHRIKRDLIAPPPDFCNTNELENMDHRLMRDIVIGRKYQQGEKQHDFSNKEVDNYFIQYQDFDNKVNNSSRNTCDVVARIAEERTAHNSELTNHQGQTIGEVFDGLTRDRLDRMKECKNPGCVQPGNFDNLTQRQFYTDGDNANSTAYSLYHTKYETDDVNNGGKFYDDIEAHDENFFFEMKVKK